MGMRIGRTSIIIVAILIILGVIGLLLFASREEPKEESLVSPEDMTKEEVRNQLMEYFESKEPTAEVQGQRQRTKEELIEYFSQKQRI